MGTFLLIGIFSALLLGILLFFNWKNKSLKKWHSVEIASLENSINQNKTQIFFRNENLDKYHFLKYNLAEALFVQRVIQLNIP
ncbi:hypothetical protein [Aequorivita echinoideorum]|uniref:hypothetical protein n=1 Tax=Aequorivita echinoideorum TaxID=1549647 RepID=UPI001BD99FBF|nr:hypothetical protein [Aequorivita echinoideorum]